MAQLSEFKKISVFYADDLNENIGALLRNLEMSGLVVQSSNKSENLRTVTASDRQNYIHNIKILNSDRCLIQLDYSNRMNDAVEKIHTSSESYDLVICDLFFGEDPFYKDSKIGGMWIILWAKHKAMERNIVCKIYTGQLEKVENHVDYQMANTFLKKEYSIEIKQTSKFQNSKSWEQNLADYFVEVRENIIPNINVEDRIFFINYLYQALRYEIFQNRNEEQQFEEFRKNFLKLKEFEFKFVNGQKIKFIHLFPLVIGRRFMINDENNFENLDRHRLEDILYLTEFEFKSKETMAKKAAEFDLRGVKYEKSKKHDLTGNPIYGLKIANKDQHEGLFRQIEKPFIDSLDYTYKIYRFYTEQKGFDIWSRNKETAHFSAQEFEIIRKDYILPAYKKIQHCFRLSTEMTFPLENYIKQALENIDESHFVAGQNIREQQIEANLNKLVKSYSLHKNLTEDIVPLQALFRIHVQNFLNKILKINEGTKYLEFENDDFMKFRGSRFFWYCNALQVRQGLKEIRNHLQNDVEYYILESRHKEKKVIIPYKIILKDSGRGIPSIARKFYSRDENRYEFDHLLKNFCKLVIFSKMEDFDGICFNMFIDKDDLPCPEIKKKGIRFEILFAQGKER